MILGGKGGIGVDPPIFRVHDFQAHGAAPCFAEAANACAARQAVLLLRGEIEKTQCQKARTVGDPAQHLSPAAKHDLGELHLAFDRRPLSGAQFAERHDPGAIFVTQRQQEQKILGGLDPQGAQPQSQRVADAAQHSDRLKGGHGAFDHSATMHSTSTCAPRGSEATPTAARAG
jgi:hypothetical protein